MNIIVSILCFQICNFNNVFKYYSDCMVSFLYDCFEVQNIFLAMLCLNLGIYYLVIRSEGKLNYKCHCDYRLEED